MSGWCTSFLGTDCVEVLKGLALPLAAIIGVGVGIFNAWTSRRKQKQELYELRMSLFKRIFEEISINPSIEQFEKLKDRGLAVEYIGTKSLNLKTLSLEARFAFDPEIEEMIDEQAVIYRDTMNFIRTSSEYTRPDILPAHTIDVSKFDKYMKLS